MILENRYDLANLRSCMLARRRNYPYGHPVPADQSRQEPITRPAGSDEGFIVSEFKLVPERMLLDKETIGAINFHCGDGGDNFGEHSDGLLWVGIVTDDEGKEVYGLHLATAEYPEEGSSTLVEFKSPEDAAQSELAALREELASAIADKDAYAQNAIDLRTSLDAVTLNLSRVDNTLLKKSLRLTAAEQRNAELVKAVDQSIEWFERISSGDGSGHADLAHAIRRIAKLKPTESGASE